MVLFVNMAITRESLFCNSVIVNTVYYTHHPLKNLWTHSKFPLYIYIFFLKLPYDSFLAPPAWIFSFLVKWRNWRSLKKSTSVGISWKRSRRPSWIAGACTPWLLIRTASKSFLRWCSSRKSRYVGWSHNSQLRVRKELFPPVHRSGMFAPLLDWRLSPPSSILLTPGLPCRVNKGEEKKKKWLGIGKILFWALSILAVWIKANHRAPQLCPICLTMLSSSFPGWVRGSKSMSLKLWPQFGKVNSSTCTRGPRLPPIK